MLSSVKLVNIGEFKAEIVSDRYNSLIGRREIVLRVDHILKGTPSRLQVRLGLARALGVDVERVYVRSIKSEYGVGASRVEVHVYDSVERALAFEPKHIVERNGGVKPQIQ